MLVNNIDIEPFLHGIYILANIMSKSFGMSEEEKWKKMDQGIVWERVVCMWKAGVMVG